MTMHSTNLINMIIPGPASSAAPKSGIEVALVMPCYNEALRLDSETILNFLHGHPAVHLILVNDGSTDTTLSLLVSMTHVLPRQITVVDLSVNSGKAEAVRQGLLHALAMDAPLVAYWDADLATPLDAVEDFARVAKRHPEIAVMFGSRRQMLGHRIRRTFMRKVISRTCATMARMALSLAISDTQCGAKLLRANDALREAVATPFTAGWLFDVELFARVRRAAHPAENGFYEFPLPQWDEIPGSKVSGRAVIKAAIRMLGLIGEYRLGLKASQQAKTATTPSSSPRLFRGGRAIDLPLAFAAIE
ncbi:MAG: glycosyltransferase [Pseudotabrizicola sp.]|uniref:glycosyltransferase n=1 Tax=Pseudotabrizicola sp. TaxID=2939647 RepID=UPI00271DFD16|nr:glycosyltransferase [Pseudotabrizicola sp.]MDO8884249.1 glycosyltransferase [Pseudotabrizicola sp.]MDP2079666.1 glycosyltransferase [Pseudotabrizicola sp.]MDZ7574571.1 glycosyltransferase [Pseudotabrizicola sp.]